MSLDVSVHRRDPTSGELGPDLVVETGANLAGFENWRTNVYGSHSVRQRARFLPQLATGDLVIEGADLVPLLEECVHVLRDIDAIANDVEVDVETLRFRVANIAAATARAISISGVVWIS
jgi:hypothetical protein